MAVLDNASIKYQAEGKLMDLVTEIAESSNLRKVKSKIVKATRIRYFLKALEEAEATYLTSKQLTSIYQCLQDVSGITEYNTVPTLTVQTLPTTLVGEKGDDGDDGFTLFEATNIDTGVSTVDSFTTATANACRWDYLVSKGGVNYRAGTIIMVHDGSTATSYETSTSDLGTTSDLVLSTTISGGNVLLQATAASDDWEVNGKRYLIY